MVSRRSTRRRLPSTLESLSACSLRVATTMAVICLEAAPGRPRSSSQTAWRDMCSPTGQRTPSYQRAEASSSGQRTSEDGRQRRCGIASATRRFALR
ncbi:hypothetical protein L226DRAFT_193411 [Lentinus tigrinus ALCF2SS1-7]|uniref:uncharacterized protein n=1 Tax=Lentinus tigrinus ALCF2SS1-7 TaxID=1328758 RepID=UPI001166397C|nr:hypothetical protein L226DRAFT_193411 [Lentinus tigrinus ALCF2SS1-7]